MELFKLFGKIAIDNSEATTSLKETSDQASKTANELINTSSKADSSGDKMSRVFKKVGGAVATFFAVDKIKNFGMGCIQASADANAASSQFTQVFGDLEGNASKSLSGIAKEAGISENRMKGSFTKIAAFAKTTGMDTEDALSLSERAMVAVADSAAFYDRSLEDTTESLQSFLKGNYENDAALGLSCTETTRNAAANELYGKSFKDLSESQKQLTLLKMVEDANKASGALGQAARESDTWTNVTGNLKQSWTDFQAVLGAKALPMAVGVVKQMAGWVQNLADKVPNIVEKFSAFKQKATELGDYIGGKLKPIFDDLKAGFDAAKDALQPVVVAFTEYFTSGQAASDITNTIKAGVDLLATAYQNVKDVVIGVVDGFKSAVEWGKQHETGVALIATAVGTLTAAVGAYNVAQAIKKAGGIAEIAQLGIMQVQLWALSAAQAAQTVATTVATAATSAFGAVMSFVTSPITLVILAIGALIAIGVALYKNWDKVTAFCSDMWTKIKELWGNIKEAISTKVSEIKDAISEKFEAAKQAVSNIFENIKNAISSAWETIKNVVQVALMFVVSVIHGAFTLITLPFRMIWENCKGIITTAWNAIKNAISTALNAIKSTITNVWNAIVSVITPILNVIKSVITTAWNNIKSTVTTVINAVKSVITSVFTAVKNTVATIWNAIKSTIASVVNSIKSVITSVWNSIKTAVSSVMNGIKSAITSAWSSVKSSVSSAINGVKSTISSGLNAAKNTVSSVLNGIKNKFSSIMNSAKSIVSGAIGKIKGFFNFSWSLPKLKMPHFSLKGKFSLNPPSVPTLSVDWYKKAMNAPMILTKPTVFDFDSTTGKAKAGGEAGSELVGGTTTVMRMIQSAVSSQNADLVYYLQKIIEILCDYFPQVLDAFMNMNLVLDDGTLVGRLAPAMDAELGKIRARKDRGR